MNVRDVFRSSELWTGVLGVGITLLRGTLHVSEPVLNMIQLYAGAYISSRLAGKVAKAVIAPKP